MLDALLAEPQEGNDALHRQIDGPHVSERYPASHPTVIFTAGRQAAPPSSVTGIGLDVRVLHETDSMKVVAPPHVVDCHLGELRTVRMDGGPSLAEIAPSALKLADRRSHRVAAEKR